VGIVARTFDDGRDVCIEGESGLLSVLDRYGVRHTWNRSLGELVLANGSRFDLYTSEKPDQLRGPQHHLLWADELGAWIRARDTWDMAMFGLRLGASPRWFATTTPRPTDVVKEAIRDAAKVSRGSTFANAANLPDVFLQRMRARYEGTRLGRQELYAELLEDVPGALWLQSQIEQDRVFEFPGVPGSFWLRNVVVGVDPSDANGEGDEFGIAVSGLGSDHELYVVESHGVQDGPVESLRRAVTLCRQYAGRIVLEKNHGGAYLIATLEQVLREEGVLVPYEVVSASDGKRARAEPVAALYEQHRVHHVGVFPELEDQLTTFTGGGKSPDRLDALVWSLTPFLGYTLAPDKRGGQPPVVAWGGDDADVASWFAGSDA
jgi:predicted phage terminase large subunit-like protein